MHILVDLHTHTIASGHGTTDTINAMAAAAAKRSIQILGISDHGPKSPGSAGLSYFRGIKMAEKMRHNVRILYGAEANILNRDGDLDIPDEILETLDFVIVSMHRPVYSNRYDSLDLTEEITRAYCLAMRHPNVRLIGHCDDSRFPVDYKLLIAAAKKYGVLPELNNVSLRPDSYRKDCRANAIRLLLVCKDMDCPIILSSDSHGVPHIGDMTAALRLIDEMNFPKELVLNDKVAELMRYI